MPQPKKSTITPRADFSKTPNVKLFPRGRALVQNLRDHPEHFGNPPIPLDKVDADLDEFQRLETEARDGVRSVIAQRDKQRDIVISDMRILVGYVEWASNGSVTIFKLSGLNQAYASYTRMRTLSRWIRKIAPGENSGDLLVYIKADDDAAHYEVRYGLSDGGQPPAEWTKRVTTNVKSAILLRGLTAGKTYEFQARILSKSLNQFTDWTDSVTFMPT